RCDAGPLSRTTGLLLGAILPWLLVIDPPCEVTRRRRENARPGPRSTPRIATTSITGPVRRRPHTGGYTRHVLPRTRCCTPGPTCASFARRRLSPHPGGAARSSGRRAPQRGPTGVVAPSSSVAGTPSAGGPVHRGADGSGADRCPVSAAGGDVLRVVGVFDLADARPTAKDPTRSHDDGRPTSGDRAHPGLLRVVERPPPPSPVLTTVFIFSIMLGCQTSSRRPRSPASRTHR